MTDTTNEHLAAVSRSRYSGGDPEIIISQHNNGEFTFRLKSGMKVIERRISKAEAGRFAGFIKSRRR